MCVCVVLGGGGGKRGGGLVPPTILFPVSSWDGCMSAQPVQDRLGVMVGHASKTLFSFFLFFFLFFSSITFLGGGGVRGEKYPRNKALCTLKWTVMWESLDEIMGQLVRWKTRAAVRVAYDGSGYSSGRGRGRAQVA